MRIHKAPYFADVVKDKRPDAEIWHWIVQRTGCDEILAWSHASSEEKAVKAAAQRLDQLADKTPPNLKSSATC